MTDGPADANNLWRRRLDLLVAIVLLAAGSAVLYESLSRRNATSRRERPPVRVPSELQKLGSERTLGSPDAPIVLLEYSDFQCLFCARFVRDVLPQLNSKYISTGKVLLAFRHFPIERIHAEAFNAAAVAECAQAQFWSAHDALFAKQASLRGANPAQIADLAGLVYEDLQPCITRRGSERVLADLASGQALQITSTPTFFIGLTVPGGIQITNVIVGARPADEFTKAIDALLSRERRAP
jgi:protein-disulfide isomerase